jgi:hypothetical protein
MLSLVQLCCQACPDNIPDTIKHHPVYREILHRTLTRKRQIELFDEVRIYRERSNTFNQREIFDSSRRSYVRLNYSYAGNLVSSTFYIDQKMTFVVDLNPDGSVNSITHYNPSGYGFHLQQVHPWCVFSIKYCGERHGIERLNRWRCEPICSVYNHGKYLGTIRCDMDLD